MQTKSCKPWTDEEIIVLRQFNCLSKELVAKINRPRSAIYSKMRSLNLIQPMRVNYPWTDEEKQKFTELYATTSTETLMEIFPVSKKCLKGMAKRLKIKKEHKYYDYGMQRKGSLEPLTQNTNEAFYWMGFFYADGHMSKKHEFVVALQESDKNHLQILANLINAKMHIYSREAPRSKTARLSVQDRLHGPILRQKFNIPILPKTYNPPENLNFLNSKEKTLSFIAGFIDGDGYVNTKKEYIKIQVHKSWFHIFQNLEMVLAEYEIKSSARETFRSDNNKTVSNLVINRVNAQKIKRALIELDVPFLKRKWDKINI